MATRKANSIAEYAAKRRGKEQRPFALPQRRSKQHRTPQSGVDRYSQGLHPKWGFIGGKANWSDRRSKAQPYTPPEPSPYAGLCLLSPDGESRSPGGEISHPPHKQNIFPPTVARVCPIFPPVVPIIVHTFGILWRNPQKNRVGPVRSHAVFHMV